MTEYPGVEIPVIDCDSTGLYEGLTANAADKAPVRITDRMEQLYNWAGITNLVYDPATGYFTLEKEEIEPDYEDISIDSGLLASFADIDASNKRLTVQLYASTAYDNIDNVYQYKAFKYDAKAFYKITFDYQVVLASSYFIVELVDDAGAVKWSTTGSATVTNQVVAMISTSWTFRVRCKADVTTDALFSNWVYIDNIRLERYHDIGSVQQGWWHHIENLAVLGKLGIGHDNGIAETSLKAQMLFSDDGVTYGAWTGPGGNVGTYYTEHGSNQMHPGTRNGYYFRTWVWLESDGRYTPTLKYLSYSLSIWIKSRPSLMQTSQIGMDPGIPVAFTPLDWNKATHYIYNNLPESGRFMDLRPTLIKVSNIGMEPGVTIIFTPLDWNRGSKTGNDYLTLSDREFIKAKSFKLSSSWLEAIWGIVMSGYCRDQNNDIILGGKQIILECTTETGKDVLGRVYPDTGLFQVFIRDAIYDKRHLIVGLDGKPVDMALNEYGEPEVLDVSEGYPQNQDLHFWKGSLCKSVAHVDSLVTY
jgi:hypothetical protein